jgi:hypothetical protein
MKSRRYIAPHAWIMIGKSLFALVAVAAVAMPMSGHADEKPRSPVVVELFTSQGCSSCPPANANLIELSKRTDVLPLSFAVTYWDYLGWKDTFDKPEYTDRQVAYEKPLGQAGPYTPQMVINGSATTVGNKLPLVEQLIASAPPLRGPSVTLGSGSVVIGRAQPDTAQADVWLVRYDPHLVEVPIGRGENTGRTLPHTHVVHDLERLGSWSGETVSFVVPAAPDGLKTALLVQGIHGGPILGAATDER